MGVDVDRYLGYMIDVQKDFKELFKNNETKYEDAWDLIENILDDKPELSNYNYKGNQYSHPEVNDIIIIDDGMCGDYTLLVSILSISRDISDYEETDVKINEGLKFAPVPEDVKDKMNNIYFEIFGKEIDRSKIFMQELKHFH